jgi:hypothetical protein
MDIISTALTQAWLDAVRRAQSERLRSFREQAPEASVSASERTLTEVIESALVRGGVQPPETLAPADSAANQVDKVA